MAAATFSTFTSSLRASQSQAPSYNYANSTLTRLPNIDIPFEDLRKRMNDFTLRFDAFLEQGRKRVLNEHNEFKAKLSELQDDNKQTRSTIATLSSQLASQQHLVTRELAEKQEIQTSIQNLEARQSTQQQQRDRLRQSIQQTQRQIESKLAAQREYAAKQDSQSALNGPELAFWETYLGLRFEGAGDECLVRVVYTFPAAKSASGDGEREASFELKVPESGNQPYEVVGARPKIDKEKIEKVVGRLNETREIGVLLKGMRAIFAEQMK